MVVSAPVLAFLLGLTCVTAVARAGEADLESCGLVAPCQVAGGSYRVSPPPGWRSQAKLPVMFFYHGHGSSAADGMDDPALRNGFADAGILLVVMEAEHGFWGHQGSRKYTRDDFAYTRAVIADVEKRWPVDPRFVVAAGFSNGGSMVWDLACHGGMFTAYVALSGEFWKPLPADCDAGPVDLLHFHGLTDRLVPIEGYRFKHGSQLLGLFPSFRVMKRVDGCAAEPDDYAQAREFVLRSWDTSCASGRHLLMALHNGGHVMPRGWIPLAWAWLQKVQAEEGAGAQTVQSSHPVLR